MFLLYWDGNPDSVDLVCWTRANLRCLADFHLPSGSELDVCFLHVVDFKGFQLQWERFELAPLNEAVVLMQSAFCGLKMNFEPKA